MLLKQFFQIDKKPYFLKNFKNLLNSFNIALVLILNIN